MSGPFQPKSNPISQNAAAAITKKAPRETSTVSAKEEALREMGLGVLLREWGGPREFFYSALYCALQEAKHTPALPALYTQFPLPRAPWSRRTCSRIARRCLGGSSTDGTVRQQVCRGLRPFASIIKRNSIHVCDRLFAKLWRQDMEDSVAPHSMKLTVCNLRSQPQRTKTDLAPVPGTSQAHATHAMAQHS